MERFQKLSRDEMKNVLAGYESGKGCSTGNCSVYDSNSGKTYYGGCGYAVQQFLCECITALGPYEIGSNGGVSACVTN